MKPNSKISKDIKNKILAEKDELSFHQIAKKYNIPIFEVKKIIRTASKKTPKWFYAVLILLPIFLLVLLEVTLRLFDYGEWKFGRRATGLIMSASFLR